MRRRTDLGLLLVVLGVLAVWNAVRWLPVLPALAPAMKRHVAVFLAGGVPVVLAGALFLAGKRARLAAWLGGAGAAACGANLIAGIALGTIPCAGPT